MSVIIIIQDIAYDTITLRLFSLRGLKTMLKNEKDGKAAHNDTNMYIRIQFLPLCEILVSLTTTICHTGGCVEINGNKTKISFYKLYKSVYVV